MAMPSAKEVFDLLEGYNLNSQVSESWLMDCRDNFVIPWVEAKTKLPFGRTETRVEYYDGTGSDILILRARPIVDLIAINYTNVPSNAFYISPLAIQVVNEEGILKARANFNEANYVPIFARGNRNLRITYSVGYVNVPADVARAVKCLVAEQALGLVSSRTGGGSLSVSGWSRNHGSRGKFTDARNDLARQALSLLRKYMTGVMG